MQTSPDVGSDKLKLKAFFGGESMELQFELREKTLCLTFHYNTGCLIGILIMVYYNPKRTW